MRLAALAFSTVLLSGCSWIGFGPQAGHSGQQHARGGQYHAPQGQYGQHAQRGHHQQRRAGPCTITKVTQPVPRGCSPEQVTMALPQYGGGQQQPGYSGQGYQQPSGAGYGGQVPTTRRSSLETNVQNRPFYRQRLRLNGGLGFERSVSGEVLNNGDFAGLYQSALHTEQGILGTPAGGQVTTSDYTVDNVASEGRGISYSDLYGSVFTTALGAEYFVTPRTAVTANASYGIAAGREGGNAAYTGDINRTASVQNFRTAAATGNIVAVGMPTIVTDSQTGAPVALTRFQANDMQRVNLEVGARHYFKPAFENYLERPVTPYVGASAGASHFNAMDVKQNLSQLDLDNYYQTGAATYTPVADLASVEVLEGGWVPSGTINLGMDWQVTERSSLGFETGVRYEGPRSKTAGGETDANISIPLTLRGSIGF